MGEYEQKAIVEVGMSASQLRGASIGKACQLVDDLVMRIMENYPHLGVVQQYRLIAETLPKRVDQNLQCRLLKEAQRNNDPQATFTFLMLNLKSVLSEAERYFNDDPERNDELVCTGMQELVARLPRINVEEQLPIQVHHAAGEGIVAFLKQNEGVSPGLTRSGVVSEIQHAANQLLEQYPWGAGKEKLQKVARKLVDDKAYPKYGPGPGAVLDYFIKRMEEGSVVPEESDDGEREMMEIFRHEEVVRQVAQLPQRERQTLEMYFWGNKNFEEIGNELHITGEGARLIWHRALQKLRYPRRFQ